MCGNGLTTLGSVDKCLTVFLYAEMQGAMNLTLKQTDLLSSKD